MDAYRSYGRGGGNGRGYQHVTGQGCNQCANNYMKRPPKYSCPDDCGDDNKHMSHMPVGMGYVPMQSWGELYEPCKALKEGTAFPCLNLIFCGSRGKM